METAAMCLMAAAAAATVFFLVTGRAPRREGELLRVKEPPMTAAFGIALWLEAGIVLYFLLTRPERVAVSGQGRINACIFLVASAALGGGALLYAFVKAVLVFSDRVVYVSPFGRRKTLRWEEIDEVKAAQSKRLTLIHRNGVRFTVGGRMEAYREFVRLAGKKIPPEAGEDILSELRIRLKL